MDGAASGCRLPRPLFCHSLQWQGQGTKSRSGLQTEEALPACCVLRPLKAAVLSGTEGLELLARVQLQLHAFLSIFLLLLYLCPTPTPRQHHTEELEPLGEESHRIRGEKSTVLPTQELIKCTFERGRTIRGDTTHAHMERASGLRHTWIPPFPELVPDSLEKASRQKYSL